MNADALAGIAEIVERSNISYMEAAALVTAVRLRDQTTHLQIAQARSQLRASFESLQHIPAPDPLAVNAPAPVKPAPVPLLRPDSPGAHAVQASAGPDAP